MIVSRTPLRVSFAGGGSDLAAFYEGRTGAVVTTAINKYIYVTINKKFDSKIRASYSATEIVDSLAQLKHELIREGLGLAQIRSGIEITSISDVPSEGTGLGSSSSYTVGLMNALHAYVGRYAGAERLAREACYIEIDRCGRPSGKQDAYIAAYGGLQYLQFNSDGSVFADPIICKPETRTRLQTHLLLLYTGITRPAGDVLREQRHNIENDADRRETLSKMVALADGLRDALCRDSLTDFGDILHQGWLLKKEMASQISNPRIDRWYKLAIDHGAQGGKVLGAGGGGFLMLYAPPERHEGIRAALPELRPVGFGFEAQGSKIIYVEEAM
ncbi:MAG TPA: GHMP kinase [Chloroflexota bacterium]|nr:GHMP kinase [Chloroflexota bacterium]